MNQATPKSTSSFDDIQEEEEDELPQTGVQSPAHTGSNKNTLEALQESTGPETPAIQANRQLHLKRELSNTQPATTSENIMDDGSRKTGTASVESGSESAGAKGSGANTMTEKANESGRACTSQAPAKQSSLPSRKSFTQLNSAKNKTSTEGTARNMTVETERVSSVPQMAVGTGNEVRAAAIKGDGTGSVRLKPSTETIRPKKEKKRAARKAPSATGTTSSKADIFEAKIKSAVDEANSSDSEETFVYESNPPEPLTRPQNRYHSRTPSMTSIASQGEHYRNRYRSEGNGTLAGKKSMKFTNSTKNMSSYGTGEGEDASSTSTPVSARPNLGNGSQQYARHIGRHGRAPGHLSLFDDNAPFTNSTKSPRKANTGSLSRRSSPRPYSPRSPHLRSAKSTGGALYDLEADDERTPLISSARTPRSVRRRGFPIDDLYYEDRETGFWKNMGRCILLGSLVLLLIILVVIALVLCSKPLEHAYVKEIANVLASDQEIIFDLKVHAVNPNLVAIQVTDLDILIHAKSKYVGTSKYWREHPSVLDDATQSEDGQSNSERTTLQAALYNATDSVDEGTDPIDDPHVMLLGQISHFDAPLIFEASPFRRQYSSSIGEVRLNKPGNSSEAGGSDRWETVIQHDFELIVRGIIKYSLPVSSRLRSSAISGRKDVHPEDPEIPDKPIDDDPKSNRTANAGIGLSRPGLRRVSVAADDNSSNTKG